MTAWMQAWSGCAARVEPKPHSEHGAQETFPMDIRRQIAALLAGMILSIQQEATS